MPNAHPVRGRTGALQITFQRDVPCVPLLSRPEQEPQRGPADGP